jgi:hypothetical protein
MKNYTLFFCLITFIICISLALYTDHRWEDWYITFRASKNLASGNGLVFNVGENLMTYTSPIGTLLPALIYFIFFKLGDDTTIWFFRICCAFVLSIVPIFISRISDKLKQSLVSKVVIILLFSFSYLIIDNTINGMESAFMVFFIAYFLYVLIGVRSNLDLHLALCFAGIMFTRPDGFIYFGAIILGFLLFNSSDQFFKIPNFLRTISKPLLYSILLFAPWVIWCYFYYGTPIPHTIIAKSKNHSLVYYLELTLNYLINFRGAPYLFLPTYATNFGGWALFLGAARVFSLVSSLYWVNFKGNKIARSISFATLIMLIYLNVVSGQGHSPWYLPSVVFPSILVVGIALNDGINFLNKILPKFSPLPNLVTYSVSFFLIAFSVLTFTFGAKSIKYQQEHIEFGNRKEIGLFLKENKKENDTVFMECLGYIGFYSEMKTLDFPGMSSPEVVGARKKLQTEKYSEIIDHLKPNWLVLRLGEVEEIKREKPHLFNEHYELVKTFDKSSVIDNLNLKFGKGFLYIDSHFSVYKYNKEV